MKRAILIFFFITSLVYSQAQVAIKTVVTAGPILVGESFRVQYIMEDVSEADEFYQPDFKGLRYVRGPDIYPGTAFGPDGPRKLKNVLYTLVATRAGKVIVPGAGARINGELVKSEDAVIEVLTIDQAVQRSMKKVVIPTNQEYFLHPGEDPYDKIRRNLFMTVSVSKKACYVGEPIVATFKLYSRLESRSDIIKNPGFYGFTVQDMVNLNDNSISIETIKGKKFDVHTVRKVQLYPLQSGSYTIDPMEVKNKVEFSKSAVVKKTEQEIIEGVVPEEEYSSRGNIEVFENQMNTVPLTIQVKALPEANRPEEFNGATGKFSISSTLEKADLARNEEGDLVINIRGKGNFTQLSAPHIEWPAGLEGFDPEVNDSLDIGVAPMEGTRRFRFRFVSAKPGHYDIPAVQMTFFDPDTNSYKTISTGAVAVNIGNRENERELANNTQVTSISKRGLPWAWISLSALMVVLSAIFLWFIKRKRIDIKADPSAPTYQVPGIEEILQPARVTVEGEDRKFYATLRDCIWHYFVIHFSLSGSRMSKYELSAAMRQKGIDSASEQTLLQILDRCETGMFTTAEMGADKQQLIVDAKSVLTQISKEL